MKKKNGFIIIIIVVILVFGLLKFSGRLSIIDGQELLQTESCKFVLEGNHCQDYSDCKTLTYNGKLISCINSGTGEQIEPVGQLVTQNPIATQPLQGEGQ